MELSSSSIKKIPYVFSKVSFSYILGTRNLEKIPYILGNGTFLYFSKRKPKKLLIFQEVTSELEKLKKTFLKKFVI